MRRLVAQLTLVLAAAFVAAVALPAPHSGASFAAQRSSPGSTLAADSAARYLRLYSQSTDPSGLTGYAIKRISAPPVPAATGADGGLSVQLGGFKNGGTADRVFTIEARNPMPVASVTVTASIAGTGISSATLANVGSSGGTASVTLPAGAKRQLNVAVPKLPGNNVLYSPVIVLTVTYPGYSGAFLAYRVPATVWDGNGAGP